MKHTVKAAAALALCLWLISSLLAGCGGGGGNKAGAVYYLNFKPEADSAWQELAKTYREQTGVDVKVVTAASGEYTTTLTAEMAKSAAPTLFQCGNEQGLRDWGDYCLDLQDTEICEELTTDDFNLKDSSGAVKAIGYCYECFGIIVNKALLREAGYSVEEINDFDSLKAVAEDIHARAEELGFDAFSSPGLDDSSSWRFSGHLVNMPLFYEFRDDGVESQPATVTGAYLDNFRQVWDLYVENCSTAPTRLSTSTGDESEAEFGMGRAVFYQNGSWEWANLTDPEKFGMDPGDLTMIPIYCGVEGEEKAGLCSGTENCWAVNAKAGEEDQKATLDFMKWVVTSEEGTSMMAEQFGPIPFKNAKEPENKFFAAANEYISRGNYTVTWDFSRTPNVNDWRAGFTSALTAYTAGSGDWAAVKDAFVAGWSRQYQRQNG